MKKLFKNQIKLIRSLEYKKARAETGLFVVEGEKTVAELIKSGYKTEFVACDREFDHEKYFSKTASGDIPEIYTCRTDEVSTLSSSEGIIAVARIPDQPDPVRFLSGRKSLLGLFGINDPGNMGTLIRTACWFGLDGILLFDDCADIYSPKVIRGSMGALFHIGVIKCGKYESFSDNLEGWTKIGTFLDEENSFRIEKKGEKNILFLGSEASGLNESLKNSIESNFRIGSESAFDSLNVSVAGGIIMREIFSKSGEIKC